ncbi:MAG: hypothetical protein C0404_13005 [Verrucomicrobia bacterium]|nr:hypothetical protein [Verrucomicrobiota bacterium]
MPRRSWRKAIPRRIFRSRTATAWWCRRGGSAFSSRKDRAIRPARNGGLLNNQAQQDPEPQKIDFRVYIGILFFRWQLIVFCFLWSLLGGIVYINLVPPEYLTRYKVMIYRDPNLEVASTGGPWRSSAAHFYLLQSEKLRKQAARKLIEKWGSSVGSVDKMMLPVSVSSDGRLGGALDVSVRSRYPGFAADFLKVLSKEHEDEWMELQQRAVNSAADMLKKELDRLTEEIKKAEDDLIEYQRLHDIARVEAKGSLESSYLQALMGRRSQLQTETMLLEAQYPALKGASVEVIGAVASLTRETGAIDPLEETPDVQTGMEDKAAAGGRPGGDRKTDKASARENERDAGWRDLRVRLARLQQREKELLDNMKPEHPEVRAVKKDIENVKAQLEIAAEIEMGVLKDRHKALQIQVNAIEVAEYKWQAKNLLASQRRAELKRIAAVVSRFEGNYGTLYARLHDIRVSEELKAEHFKTLEDVATIPQQVWPDPIKIMLMVVTIGLGAGLGLVVLSQMLDNKIQTISDVEGTLGVPFLGGVPFWVHSGLEQTIRPIVTEEHSTGAIEAYRALRTSVLAALGRAREKILIVTSADSKEGKTLTALNMAIMISQMGRKVLLVDMDLRRGRLHRSLGIEREPGITDCLRDSWSLRRIIVPTRFENLSFAPAGATIDNTAELLHSADVAAMYHEIQDDYDYILIDTSPVLRVTDTVILAEKGFGSLLYVARVNKTPKPLIKYSLDLLKNARILGLVMNSIEMHKIGSLYYSYQYPNYAYYSNAYAYGYDYYYYGEQQPGKPPGGAVRRRGGPKSRVGKFAKWVRRTFLPME